VVDEVQDERRDVVVVTSMRIGRLQSPFSCSGHQLAQAARRRYEVLKRLSSQGVAARGLVGDPDPLLAVGDVLARLDSEALVASRILVVTDSADPSDWREHRLTERLEAAYAIDVTHRLIHDLAVPS
jgi:hypothetical protein